MKSKKNRNIIPVGIFIIIFTFLIILSAAISTGYFYFVGKNRITEIVSYTRSYSIPLAEAFANVAELSYKNGRFKKLKKLFREKIQEKTIDEAFYVLSNGDIIVHSDKKIEDELKGNIATDEFAYNIDLILLPIWSKTENAQFIDYHIYSNNEKLRYNKKITKLLKKYIYSKIDVVGWLVTRAVYVRGKSIGCVSFIISKDRIYNFLLEHYNVTVKLSIILSAISFFISLMISIIVFIRYRSFKKVRIQKRIIKHRKVSVYADNNERKLKEAIRIKSGSGKIKKVKSEKSKLIKDAILVSGK